VVLAVAVVVVAVVVAAVVLLATVGVRAEHSSRTAGTTLTTPFLSYAPPAGWSAPPPDLGAGTDAPALTGVVHGPGYECGGQSFLRGFAAAALLPTAAEVGPAELAERLARWFAATSYAAPGGAPPDVSVAPPRPVPVDGPGGTVAGTVVEVSVQMPAGPAGCSAGGTVLALGAPVSGGAALLLVAGDSAGGPTEPAAPDRSTLDAVLASVRLGPP
jgi:hypothetical protein